MMDMIQEVEMESKHHYGSREWLVGWLMGIIIAPAVVGLLGTVLPTIGVLGVFSITLFCSFSGGELSKELYP